MLAVITVIVDDQDRFLLIQESKKECRGTWFFPGGRVHGNETLMDAAIREVKEEAGINVALTGLLYIDQRTQGESNRIRFVFIGERISGELKTVEDGHSILASWKSVEEIKNMPLRSPFVQKVIGIYGKSTGLLNIQNIHVISSDELRDERP